MTTFTLHQGDCLAVMRAMPDNSVDAIVTDPPYHLTTGKKGGSGPASVSLATPAGRARVTTGFMGMKWDGGAIAHSVEMWAEALRVLKPGGHLLAFAGSRTYHRMTVAIEDAGFEIRDQIMWLTGQGFPKSKNLDGDHKGWGSALKPAHEPICMARKPLGKGMTIAANVAAHGTGALNIDACRVAFAGAADERESKDKNAHGALGSGPMTNQVFGKFSKDREDYNPTGRWPANLIHDGSPEVLAAFPESSVTGKRGARSKAAAVRGTAWLADNHESTEYTDSGSAARFFYCAKASRLDRNEGCEAMPAKPLNWSSGEQNPGSFQSEGTDKTSQNHHPTVKPTDLMAYLVRLVTPPGGLVLDIFCGSGSTGKACAREGFDFIGIDLDPEYVAIARARIEYALQRRRRANRSAA